MDDEAFEGIVQGLREVQALYRGEHVIGMRIHHPNPVDIAAIRKRTGLSQAAFSRTIGVSPGTLRNWEQGRRTPEGPARILLAMLARDPEIVARTLKRAA